MVYSKIYNWFKNIAEENMSQERIPKNMSKMRTHFLEEIQKNRLMRKKYEKVCTTLYYIEHFLIVTPTISGCLALPKKYEF